MCGISGFISDNPAAAEETLNEFNKLQGHRGPDNNNTFFDGYAGLAHQRLKIIDLSENANQPMVSKCKRYVIVYNGEVYNFQQILQDIKKSNPGYHPETSSDTEIVLQAYVVWGSSFVEKLNGMFAIAIYDKHNKDIQLFRDRTGIKPLFYYHKNDVFAFASELKTLAKTTFLKNKISISYEALNQFLHLGYVPAPNTIYKEIKKLEAGCKGSFKKGNFSVSSWWKPGRAISKSTISSEYEALEQLKFLAESSIKQCLISDVPFGTFLSGGIDSSLVTAIAQKYSKTPINTFCIAFDDNRFNEAGYASNVASFLKTNHREFKVTHNDALEWVPKLTDIYDEPFADSSALPTLLVSKLAKNHVTMVLSGDGGDELFMGYGAYNWAKRLENPLVKIAKKPLSLALEAGGSRLKRAAQMLKCIDNKHKKSHIFSQEQYLFSRKEIKNLINREYYNDFVLPEEHENVSRGLSPAEQQALFDLKLYLPDDLLVKVDRASMFFGLETRVPLLDYRIIEFALNLDYKLKVKSNNQKYLLKKLLFEYVPESFFNRPKKGFAIPLAEWMKNQLYDFINDWASDEMLKKHSIFNTDAVNKIKNNFYKKNINYLYNRIWQIVVLQMWLENQYK